MARALAVLSAAAACDAGSITAPPPRPRRFDAIPSELIDASGRRIAYVRLSITDRCDLACVYCMPPEGERQHARRSELLDFDELARLAAVLAACGVRRLRLTGGEPLVRRDVVELVRKIRARAPSLELALTTNGTRLRDLARPLAEAGIGAVNVSIDSLDPARFAALSRGGELAVVLEGIDAALAAGMKVKTNSVVVGRESLAEMVALIDWAWSRGITPRFIELMPIGEAGKLERAAFVPAEAIAQAIAARAGRPVPAHGVAGPAVYVEGDGGRRVGLIAATTRPFCDTCNRTRITARGELRGCLGSPHGVALREVIRGSDDDRDVAWALHAALGTKAARHGFAFGAEGVHEDVGMSLVGG